MKRSILLTNVLLITNFNFLANINATEEHHPLEGVFEHHTPVISNNLGENEGKSYENSKEKEKRLKGREKHPKKHQKQEHEQHILSVEHVPHISPSSN